MLLNKPVPNLFQGVSQQPPSLRLATQGETQENAYSSIVEGLRKRPPTNHVAKVTSSTASDAFVHAINRDAVEQYVVVITNGDLAVYDMAGTAMTVSFPSGKAYLTATTPRTSFSCVTIADYTFVVNKGITVTMAAGTSAGSLTGTVQSFAKLPASPSIGNIYKIQGDETSQFAAYYVKYVTGNVWEETLAPGIQYTYTATTMPWKLIRTGVGTFTFDVATWGNRLVGDTVTNPNPSFVGKTINDVFFFRNRLGFCADENLIMSEAGEFFTFWQKSMTALIDSDPIDVAVSGNAVSIIKHAIPFNTTLLLFSDQAQFQVTTPTNTALTPKSVTVNATTRYQTDNLAKPVGVGQDVYFSVSRGSYTGLMEYYVQAGAYSNEASDTTAHVPKYLPAGVFKLIGSSLYDTVFALNTTNRNEVYVYKFYWGEDDKKAQSSWSVWKFDSADIILGGEQINNKLFLVIQRADGIFLEYVDLQANVTDTGMGVLVHVDRRKSLTGSYSSGTNLTTWTIPYVWAGTVNVVLGSTYGTALGTVLTTSRPTTTTVTAVGDYSSGACWVGIPYTMKYRFSEFFFKDDKGNTVSSYQLKLKDLRINYSTSGYFQVTVAPPYRDTGTYTMTGNLLGTSTIIGQISISSGEMRVPILAGSEGTVIEITNNTYLPCAIQSAEWNAKMSSNFKRM